MSLDIIQARIASIGIAIAHADIDSEDLRDLNSELDRLLSLLVEMSKVKF